MATTLAQHTASCPFCKGTVPQDTLRFGANCPHCMLEIPGEEAPTDPGLEMRQRKEQEERARRQREASRTRVVAGLAFGVLLVAGAAGAWSWRRYQDSLAYDIGEYFQIDLDEIEGPPPVAAVTEALPAAGSPAAGSPAAGSPAGSPAGRSPRLVTPRPIGDTIVLGVSAEASASEAAGGPKRSSDGALADVAPAGMGASVSNSVAIGEIGLRRESDANAVLTDQTEMLAMAKRFAAAYRTQLQTCYVQRLKQGSTLEGTWKVSFVITPDGLTRDVAVSGVGVKDGELETCMKSTVGKWKFQKIARALPINLPIPFRTSW